jgi:hypothetical protein
MRKVIYVAILVGNLWVCNIITCVIAPTNPDINAAANMVCALKYGCKYRIKSNWRNFGSLS